jgi:hypothetical protein
MNDCTIKNSRPLLHQCRQVAVKIKPVAAGAYNERKNPESMKIKQPVFAAEFLNKIED